MKQVLSLAPLALPVISGGFLVVCRESLGGLPGALPFAWLLVLALFGGSLVTAIEAAHDRRKGPASQ